MERMCIFQFTPLCERLHINKVAYDFTKLFQFTPLCERLHHGQTGCFFSSYFNSRLSARGYVITPYASGSAVISIHASLREATEYRIWYKSENRFQFTPLCERLPFRFWRRKMSNKFQFTPLCERLLWDWRCLRYRLYFNSRLSARGYACTIFLVVPCRSFQFTPLCERLRWSACTWFP